MKRILFVDDESQVLQGLQRMLRPMRNEWDMRFSDNAQAGLALMEQEGAFDVVMTDMRMPGMDGLAFLSIVMERYPATVRMVLSGHTDNETLFRSAGISHQFISKPCEADTLKNLVERAFALRDVLHNERLEKLLARIETIPSVPTLYMQVMEELRSRDPDIRKVAEVIGQDFGMCAKLLHFVNSAYFGLLHHVSNPLQAINYIGLNNLRSLILSVSIFEQVDTARLPRAFSMNHLWQHSLVVAAYARAIAKAEKADGRLVDDAYTAGLLHDAGILVLANNMPEQYTKVLVEMDGGRSLDEAEMEIIGATHAEVGAYLLALWGLPDPLVEAVAYHHKPSQSLARSLNPLFIVHVADCMHSEKSHKLLREGAAIDAVYLSECHLEDRLPDWRAACQNVGAEL